MFDVQYDLVSRWLAAVADELVADPANPAPWARADAVLAPMRESEPELARAIEARDVAALRTLVDDWKAGKRLLPEPDRNLLKRALKAFRTTLKVTRLDEESRIGGGAMSSGRRSSIVGITPPGRYTREVWDELVRQGRLRGGRNGIYEPLPE